MLIKFFGAWLTLCCSVRKQQTNICMYDLRNKTEIFNLHQLVSCSWRPPPEAVVLH